MWSRSERRDRLAEIETRRLSHGEDDPFAQMRTTKIVGWPVAEPRPITMQSRVNDAYWSLAMTLAWIAYRTETAVINIKSGRWAPNKGAIRELVSALRSGKLAAHGMFEGERIPHPIETAVWANFEIIVKPMRFTGHTSLMPIVIARRWALREPDCSPRCRRPKSGNCGQRPSEPQPPKRDAERTSSLKCSGPWSVRRSPSAISLPIAKRAFQVLASAASSALGPKRRH